MKSVLRLAAAACLATGLFAQRASADITYDLVGVKLADAWGNPVGGLTGSFTTDNERTALRAAELIAEAGTAGGWSYSAATYTLAHATVPSTLLPQNILRFNIASLGGELQLYFQGGLAETGATLGSNNSYEHQNAAGNRSVSSGSVVARSPEPPVTAVPEPSGLAVAAICVPALLAYGWRSRRKATEAA